MSDLTYEERRTELLARFKKLREEAQKDMVFDKAQMDKQFDTTQKITKWLNKRHHWNDLCRSYEFKRLQAWKKAFEFYKTEYKISLSNNDDYRNMISTDPSYAEIADLAMLVSDIVDYIDSTIENLKQRAWEMKHFTEWLRFTHGL
jgi:hypothetical protein